MGLPIFYYQSDGLSGLSSQDLEYGSDAFKKVSQALLFHFIILDTVYFAFPLCTEVAIMLMMLFAVSFSCFVQFLCYILYP